MPLDSSSWHRQVSLFSSFSRYASIHHDVCCMNHTSHSLFCSSLILDLQCRQNHVRHWLFQGSFASHLFPSSCQTCKTYSGFETRLSGALELKTLVTFLNLTLLPAFLALVSVSHGSWLPLPFDIPKTIPFSGLHKMSWDPACASCFCPLSSSIAFEWRLFYSLSPLRTISSWCLLLHSFSMENPS